MLHFFVLGMLKYDDSLVGQLTTSLPLPAVSQVELLRLFGPERPELDLGYVWQCLFTFGSERLELKR